MMTTESSLTLESPPPAIGKAWRYVWIDQGLVAIFVNFAINWGIARAVFGGMETVPRDGELSMAGDTLATCWMLPLISCLIVTSLTRNEIRQGRIPSFTPWQWSKGPGRYLLLRAGFWGIVGRFLIAPIAVYGLNMTSVESLPLQTFLIAKALFACVLGMFFCPFHAWVALHDGIPRWFRPRTSVHG